MDESLVAPPVRPKEDEGGVKRAKIFKDDLIRLGYTVGCQGCRAAIRGNTAQSHTEECRKRIETELRKESNRRVLDANERKKKSTQGQDDSAREEPEEEKNQGDARNRMIRRNEDQETGRDSNMMRQEEEE